MTKRLLGIALIASVLLGGVGQAHERVLLDTDDSPGPLDVVAARLRHSGGALTLRVVTYEEWPSATLEGDLNYVRFDLDLREDPGIERCLLVHSAGEDGGGHATLYKRCNVPLPFRGPVADFTAVSRPDLHTVEVSVPESAVWNRRPARFVWNAQTSFEEEGHADCAPPDPFPPEHFVGTCSDDTEWQTHRRTR